MIDSAYLKRARYQDLRDAGVPHHIAEPLAENGFDLRSAAEKEMNEVLRGTGNSLDEIRELGT